MKDQYKKKKQLIEELEALRRQVVKLRREEAKRKRTEEALRESEEKFATAFRNSPDSITLIGLSDERVVEVNDGFCHATGYRREEILGHTSLELNLWPDLSERARFVSMLRDQKRVIGFEASFRIKSGEIRVGLAAGKVVQIGDKPFALITIRDITEHKGAENALIESEERYRRLVENSPAIVWSFSDKRGTLFVSSRVKSILGYSPDFLYENPWLWNKSIHPDDQHSIAQVIKDFASGRDLKVEYRIKDSSGNWRWLYDRSVGRHTEGAEVIIEGISIDITERKQAEEALRESEEKYRALIEAAGRAGEGIIIIQDSGEGEVAFVSVNDQFCAMSGYSREELVGRSPWDLVPHEISVRLKDWYRRRHIGESVPKHYEAAGVRKDGTIVPLELSSVTMPWQGKIATVLYLRDITERKQAEEALQKSEARYRSLFDGVPIGLYQTTPTGQIMDVNPALVQMLGYPDRNSLLMVNTGDTYVNLEDRIRWESLLEHEGVVKNFQKKLRRHDGSIIWVEGNTRTVRDAEGRVQYYEASFQDITERKQAEKERGGLFEQVRTSRERLRNLSRRLVEVQEIERRDLVRKLHDEVGQNLTALSINLNIVHSELPRGTVTKTATRIDDSLKLVEETVERIRDVMAELRPPVLDDYGISAALYWYGKQFSERTGIATVLNAEDLKPRLSLPAEMALFRIAQEALTNVAKYAHAKNVKLRLEEFGESVHLSIIDDGIGFDLEAHHQAEAKPGWGLINMSERAQGVGGHLSVETAKGKGTQIVAEVPRDH